MTNYWKSYENIRKNLKLIVIGSPKQLGAQIGVDGNVERKTTL